MHVIVVGAGPSGLAVSLGLSSSLGCTIDLLEKHAGFNIQGSTLGLAPNGVKALQEICPDADVHKTLVSQGLPIQGFENVMLAWWIVRDWLLERVKQDSKIKLHMNSKLISFEDDDESDHVTVHCQANTTFYGDFVIGADGVHSQVRSLLGVAPSKKTGYWKWRGSANAEGDPLLESLISQGVMPLGYQLWGRSTCSVFNHHPQLPMRLNWVFSSNDSTIQPGISTPFGVAEPHMDDKIKPIVQRLFQKSAPHELTKCFEMATTVLPDETTATGSGGWGGRGRVTLIGDAAHAIRPTSGLGTALAFEDCVVLCRKLKTVIEKEKLSRQEMEQIILGFENERLKRVKKISDEQHEAAEASHRGETPKPWSKEYKDWIYSGV